jgi:uncharacterized OsmC-like protein
MVTLEIVVASEADRKKAKQALQQSEESCLVSNSVEAVVTVESQILLGGGPGPAPES